MNNDPRLVELEEQIGHDLPLGSKSADVLKWLDMHHLPHSKVVEHQVYTSADPKSGIITRVVMANDELPARSFLVKRSAQIKFDFDEHYKLIHYSVDLVLTGP